MVSATDMQELTEISPTLACVEVSLVALCIVTFRWAMLDRGVCPELFIQGYLACKCFFPQGCLFQAT